MYDIFIDEEKAQGYIGFLVVRHTPELQKLLLDIRTANQNYRPEIKYVTVNNTRIHIILSWLNILFNSDCCVGFYYRKWNKTLNQKRNIVTKVITKLKKLKRSSNFVVFMDFDTTHENIGLQEQIRKNTRILRSYQFDSRTTDILQLTDVLLQCAIKAERITYNKVQYVRLIKRMHRGVSMKKPELKKLIVYHAIKQNQKNRKIKKQIA